jgi:hypothetical protein
VYADVELPSMQKGTRRAHGHNSLQRQEQIPSRGSEEKAQPKKSNVSASADVLKEHFEKRQTHAGASPEEKMKANKSAGEDNKKTKKKKV